MAQHAEQTPPIWDFANAPLHPAPGVAAMVGYRALDVPEGVHRGMPASTLTFIISLDDGVQAAEQVGLSQRHLSTLFRREVGRSPKEVAMLMRFEFATARMAHAARGRRRVDLADTAVAAGYADQAQLTREFVRYAGTSPGAWLAEEFQNIQDGGHGQRSQWGDDCFEPDRLVDPASA